MGGKRKALVELDLMAKRRILQEINNGRSVRDLGKAYGISKSTVSNIKANKDNILKAFEDNRSLDRRRRLRKTNFEDVNNAMVEFFKKCRAKNIPITGPMLQEKAKHVAEELKIENFHASNGWLDSFRTRNNIQFRALCGEGANINYQAASDWKQRLPEVLKDFAPEDQFNADEAGFFYKQLPTKSLVEKGENCKGGKLAKERISVLFCCSAVGEKLKPLVIGNAACPRIFKRNRIDPTNDNFIVKWCWNKKSWMTSIIFSDWLKSINNYMKRQNRKIILLIDNASSHNATQELSNVLVKFLPPNLTCEIQPLDQGVIQNVKLNYRRKMLSALLLNIDEFNSANDFAKTINVLDAIRWIHSSWEDISSETIKKCFLCAGFPLPSSESEEENLVDLSDMEQIISNFPESIRNDFLPVEQFAVADSAIPVHECFPDQGDEILEDIIRNSRTESLIVDDSEDDILSEEEVTNIDVPPITAKDALFHVNELTRYVSVHQPELISDVLNLKTKIEQYSAKSKALKQTNLSRFFNKA